MPIHFLPIMTQQGPHGVDPETARMIAAEVDRQTAEFEEKEDPVLAGIRKNIKFRLMGYTVGGDPIDKKEDLAGVLELERELVIDPRRLKEEFKLMRQARRENKSDDEMQAFALVHTQFGKYGAHVSRNIEDVLMRVRREGWIVYAGLEAQNGDFHTLGYNYGLNSMPEDDEEFRVLSQSTLNVDANLRQQFGPHNTSINWRTGIAQSIGASVLRNAGIEVPVETEAVSIRRLGIASALKYIMTSMAQKRGAEKVMFNIGTLYDATPGSEEIIRNSPSYFHNRRIFREDLGLRSYNSHIVIKGPMGERERVAIVRWRPHWDKVNTAMEAAASDEGVIKSRNLDINELENSAALFYELLRKEAAHDGSVI